MPAKGQKLDKCKKGGHVIAIVGRDRTECRECKRIRQREARRIASGTPPWLVVENVQPIPNLKKVRKSLNMSQMDLAKLSGVSKSHIGRVEIGVNDASQRVREKIVVAIMARQRRIRREYARGADTPASAKLAKDTPRVGA